MVRQYNVYATSPYHILSINILPVSASFGFLSCLLHFTGILELIPAITFLFIMHPQMNPGDRSYSPTPEIPHHRLIQSGSGVISRVDSSLRAPELEGLLTSSSSSGHIPRRETPLALQHKGYGSATMGNSEVSTKI
jgi:hypothetical protein